MPEEYAASLKSDEGRYAKAVKISGATADFNRSYRRSNASNAGP